MLCFDSRVGSAQRWECWIAPLLQMRADDIRVGAAAAERAKKNAAGSLPVQTRDKVPQGTGFWGLGFPEGHKINVRGHEMSDDGEAAD